MLLCLRLRCLLRRPIYFCWCFPQFVVTLTTVIMIMMMIMMQLKIPSSSSSMTVVSSLCFSSKIKNQPSQRRWRWISSSFISPPTTTARTAAVSRSSLLLLRTDDTTSHDYYNPPIRRRTLTTFPTTTRTTTTAMRTSSSNIQDDTGMDDEVSSVTATNSTSTSTSNSSSSSKYNNINNINKGHHTDSIPAIVLKRNVQSRTFRDGNQLIYRKSFLQSTIRNNSSRIHPPSTSTQILQTGDVVLVSVELNSSKNQQKHSGSKSNATTTTTGKTTPSTHTPPPPPTTTTPVGFGIYNAFSLYSIRLVCHNTIQPILYKNLLQIVKNERTGNEIENGNDTSIHPTRNQKLIRCIVEYHIRAAIQLRQCLHLGTVTTTTAGTSATTHQPNPYETDTYRLLNGEGDGLSGLAIDVIGGDHIVVMSSAIWCELYKDIIMEELREQCSKMLLPNIPTSQKNPSDSTPTKTQIQIIWKTAPARLIQDGMDINTSTGTAPTTTPRRKNEENDGDDDDLDDEGEYTTTTTTTTSNDVSDLKNDGPDEPHHPMVLSVENGIYYETYPSANGQKTGVYSDQRSNRYMITQYCHSKRVLDLCCYTGGFTLNAMIHGRAASCVGVDSSPIAIATCYANAKRNHLSNDTVSFIQSDITTYLQQSIRDRIEYDIVILDPPKLAPSIKLLDKAKRKYHALNRDAISIISHENGGLLLSCTCSAAMTQDDGGQTFLKMIQTAAQSCSKHVTLLNVYGAASCHTQSPMAFPASNYLTAALFYVHPKR